MTSFQTLAPIASEEQDFIHRQAETVEANMSARQKVAVYGAYGYTGAFVVGDLKARGYDPVAAGRDAVKLQALADAHPGLDIRVATVDDADSLDRALSGTAAVINCAGPFVKTVAPVAEAALRAGIAYVDVAAEVQVAADLFDLFDERAKAAGVVMIPSIAFYGGLGDLLVTAAMGDWQSADQAHIAWGLSMWHPTDGTRNTIAAINESTGGRMACYSEGHRQFWDGDLEVQTWTFPGSMGEQKVLTPFSFTDIVTIPSHLNITEVRGHIPASVLTEVLSPETPTPVAVDERGRSAQTFLVDVVVRSGGVERRAWASGQDAYHASSPMAVEAVHRILSTPPDAAGVIAAGAIFDAPDFLRSLAPDLTVELNAAV